METDEGGFLCTATKTEGPWEIKKLQRGFHVPDYFSMMTGGFTLPRKVKIH